MPKVAVPVTLAGMSSRGSGLPISLNSDGFLSGGGGIVERSPTKSTSSPNVATRLPSLRRTSPSLTISWATGRPALRLAARSSRSRATAPAVRIGSQASRVDVEPPVASTPSTPPSLPATQCAMSTTVPVSSGENGRPSIRMSTLR